VLQGTECDVVPLPCVVCRVLDSSELDAVDHFSLNQSRAEDITLKEDFANDFIDLMDFGRLSCCRPSA